MNYANTWKNGCTCYHCKQSIDGHAIPMIQSDDATTTLAKNLQQKLDGVLTTALSKGYVLPVGVVMVGAAIATVGSSVIKVAALSGYNASAVLSLIPGGLGSDVVLIGNNVPINSYVNVFKEKLNPQITDIDNSVGNHLPLNINDPAYPVGSCAAQKLVDYIVKQSDPDTKRINKINMAEIFWKSTAGKSVWSTGDLVPSCNTCNYVLPMMLCNYKGGEKFPYKTLTSK